MAKTGHADLPLHYGNVPYWLSQRMKELGTLIVESLVYNFGKKEVLRRLSDPLWFQSLGAVLGMDWHSSGITTSVMGALKRGVNPLFKELGIYFCGGRGKYSLKTPDELVEFGMRTGQNGDELAQKSRLCAKVDNTAIQDGFQLYMHNFIVTDEGDWAVIQQGMNPQTKTARRYHWFSADLQAYTETPHSGVVGRNMGQILNLTDIQARTTKSAVMELTKENPDKIVAEYKSIVLPNHHEVMARDVDLKRLGAVLATAYETQPTDFDNLLLTKGLGPRTIQSLTLISEVIYGTPSRFCDPARFSFAHGGKDGHPFPVPTKIYDQSIHVLRDCIRNSRLGINDKNECLHRLHKTALEIEAHCQPQADFDAIIAHEKAHSKEWGGRTVMD